MIATWLLGLALAWLTAACFWRRWLQTKFAAGARDVRCCTAIWRAWSSDFAADRNQHARAFYRIVNEVPAVLLIVIVVLVMVKPF